jgi:NADH-ubiquinone oxidoreductase chain 2
MPKISILILLLELHTQIGFIGGLNSLTIDTNFHVDFINSISTNINEINNGLNLSSLKLIGDVAVDNSIYILKYLLLISSLLSLIIGSVVGLAQTRIKRLLAYSTIVRR